MAPTINFQAMSLEGNLSNFGLKKVPGKRKENTFLRSFIK